MTGNRRIVGIIPARMASTRFPGKPLVPLLGLPMIEHVRRRVALSSFLAEVVVATCDQEIADVVTASGGKAVLTSDRHERCTDRVAEAARQLEADIIVNVQGDEPCVVPEMLEALIGPFLADRSLPCTNLMAPIATDSEFDNANVVKVVANLKGEALYFSREAIPSRRKAPDGSFARYKQLGIVAFRSEFLHEFAKLPPTPLEIVESVDMMRAVEHGYRVRMVETRVQVIGVDVPGDVLVAERLLSNDPLLKQYITG